MNVELAAVRGALGLGHVLPQDLDGLSAHHEERTEVADQGREDVLVPAALERVRRGDRLTFLSQGAKQAADDLALPIQRHQPLFERAGKPQVVIDLEQLVARQRRPRRPCPGGDRRRWPRRWKSHGLNYSRGGRAMANIKLRVTGM